MKKSALMLAAATSFAAAEAHKGFSVGLNAGYATLDSKNTLKTNQQPLNYAYDQSGRGFLGGLNLGYFHAMGALNLGFQVQGNLGTANGSAANKSANDLNSWKIELKQKWETNASVRLGASMCGALPYVRVGASFSKFDARASAVVVGAAKTTSKTASGVLAGVGVDVPVNDKMTVGVDARMTFYSAFDAKQVSTGGGIVYTHNIKPATSVVSVGLKYFF